MTRAAKLTFLAAFFFPTACMTSYWEDHVFPLEQKMPVLPSTIFLSLSAVLTMYVMELREAFLREVFRAYPGIRMQSSVCFDPKSVSVFSTWTGLLGIVSSVFVAHGGLQNSMVHDTFVIIGGVGITFYLISQVGLSYTAIHVTSHRVARLRNFLRWCCQFVLSVWLIVSVVAAYDRHSGQQAIGQESLVVLRKVCLLSEAATLLLLSVFLATFVHEFGKITVQHFKVSFVDPTTHLVKVEKQSFLA